MLCLYFHKLVFNQIDEHPNFRAFFSRKLLPLDADSLRLSEIIAEIFVLFLLHNKNASVFEYFRLLSTATTSRVRVEYRQCTLDCGRARALVYGVLAIWHNCSHTQEHFVGGGGGGSYKNHRRTNKRVLKWIFRFMHSRVVEVCRPHAGQVENIFTTVQLIARHMTCARLYETHRRVRVSWKCASKHRELFIVCSLSWRKLCARSVFIWSEGDLPTRGHQTFKTSIKHRRMHTTGIFFVISPQSKWLDVGDMHGDVVWRLSSEHLFGALQLRFTDAPYIGWFM